MSAPNSTVPERPHRNHGLFSDHYLNATLPQRPGWKALVGHAQPVMEKIARVFEHYVPSDNEAQTERDLVRPVLDILGHDFEVQPALRTPDGTKRPDYVFYRNRASLNANKDRTLDDEMLATSAFAVGDAKHWNRRLDVSLKGRGDHGRDAHILLKEVSEGFDTLRIGGKPMCSRFAIRGLIR